MPPWFLIFAGGLLGSSHCVGMCGGFVVTLGTTKTRWRDNLTRQVIYCVGRIFTYTLGGGIAGFAGWRLQQALPAITNLQAAFAILAGVLLIMQGLMSAGLLRPLVGAAAKPSCLAIRFFASLLHARDATHVFLAGLLNGLLPCGLVYAYLALAASAGELWSGALTMTLFGLGTMPLMVLVGCGGNLVNLAIRRKLIRAAAWCVVITGLLSLVRGIEFVHWPGITSASTCPYCQ